MRCPRCTTDVSETNVFCPACGLALSLTDPGDLPAGTRLHHDMYVVDAVIGRGGFSVTYLATHRDLKQRVAIKEFFPASLATRDPATGHLVPRRESRDLYRRALQRVIREGQLLVRFDHRGIVRVHNLFQERNTAYLVMELVEGRTLAEELRERGALPGSKVREIVGQLVEALAALHELHICHLDIKANNVMLTPASRAVLLDFGAARQLIAASTGETSIRFGSPNYAPLEVINGEETGPESDIFELGVLIHEMVTGERPPTATQRARRDTWTPDRLPEPWRRLCAAALRLDRTARPADIRAWWEGIDAPDQPGDDTDEDTVVVTTPTELPPTEVLPSQTRTAVLPGPVSEHPTEVIPGPDALPPTEVMPASGGGPSTEMMPQPGTMATDEAGAVELPAMDSIPEPTGDASPGAGDSTVGPQSIGTAPHSDPMPPDGGRRLHREQTAAVPRATGIRWARVLLVLILAVVAFAIAWRLRDVTSNVGSPQTPAAGTPATSSSSANTSGGPEAPATGTAPGAVPQPGTPSISPPVTDPSASAGQPPSTNGKTGKPMPAVTPAPSQPKAAPTTPGVNRITPPTPGTKTSSPTRPAQTTGSANSHGNAVHQPVAPRKPSTGQPATSQPAKAPLMATDSSIDRARGVVRAHGVGVAPASSSGASARVLARRAALVVAERNLLRALQRATVAGNSDTAGESVSGTVPPYTVAREQQLDARIYEVVIEADLP